MNVSIIMPCYNGERYLVEAIESALAQDYAHKEIIVVDDGSKDGSAAIIARYANSVLVVRQPNTGPAAARNAGIRVSSGDLLAFLDADDWWASDFLSSMVAALRSTGAGIAYCGWQNVGLPGTRGEPFVPPDYEADPNKLQLFLTEPRWPVHAAVVRRRIVDEAGGFGAQWRTCEDFALWLRTAIGPRLARVPKVLAFYRHHPEQTTRDRLRVAIDHWGVQLEFLRYKPEIARALGRRIVRRLTHGELLRRGFQSYWAGDLAASRRIFRIVMSRGYGSYREWRYMLPALLPLSWHAALLKTLRHDHA